MKTLKLFLSICFILIISYCSFAQQSNEIDSKSLRPPRYNDLSAITAAITSPQVGMLVYNSATSSNWIYNGGSWVNQYTTPQWFTNGADIYRGGLGKVGIGTSTPAAQLDVKSASSYVAQFNGAAPMYMGFFENDIYRAYLGSYSGNAEDVDFGTGAGNSTGKLHFTIQANPQLTIAADGKVGIGTTIPNHKLHVAAGDLFVNSNSGAIRLGFNGGNEWQMISTGGGADLRWNTSTNGGATINPRHYFSQNGNVGIGGFSGAGTPNARLDIIGIGNTSVTNTFIARNSLGDTLMRIRDDGRIGIGYNGSNYGRIMNLGGNGINFYKTNSIFGGSIFPDENGNLVLWSSASGTVAGNNVVLQPSWGSVTIGTYTHATGYKLSVNGKIICTDAVVNLPLASWPDYVFKKDYKLMPLEELEASIIENSHLPNIPSASEIEKSGVKLGEMNKNLLEKIEELTLYVIELNKQNKQLQARVNNLEKK